MWPVSTGQWGGSTKDVCVCVCVCVCSEKTIYEMFP